MEFHFSLMQKSIFQRFFFKKKGYAKLMNFHHTQRFSSTLIVIKLIKTFINKILLLKARNVYRIQIQARNKSFINFNQAIEP